MAEGMKRILVADDLESHRKIVTHYLLRAGYTPERGYEIRTAKDGLQAHQLAAEGGFSLLVTDNQMPGMTGLELLKKLEGYPCKKILLTGDLLDPQQVERAGAFLLRKPVLLEKFRAVMEALYPLE